MHTSCIKKHYSTSFKRYFLWTIFDKHYNGSSASLQSKLSSADFFLFGRLKGTPKDENLESIAKIQSRVIQALKMMQEEAFQDTF